MQRVTVTFDLVFDLRRVPGSRVSGRRSLFSFTADGETHRELKIPGWPRLQVGDTVTALLRRKGDWHTLVGWVNHDTGEVVAPSLTRPLGRAVVLALGVGALVTALWSTLTINMRSTPLRDLSWLLWVGYGFFLLTLIVAMMVRQWRRRRIERMLQDQLRELKLAQKAAPTGASPPPLGKARLARSQASTHPLE